MQPEWIDYNGHLSEPYYVLVCGHATDAVMEAVGLGPDYRAETGASLYTVEALSTGGGRDGHVKSTDGKIDLDTRPPKEMGGSGEGANPEQLFAAGYAACYHSALKAVAKDKGVDVENSSVGARVKLGKNDEGFFLGVDLEVTIPGVEDDKAQELADAAHQMCPYSKATRGNIEVNVGVAQD